MAKEVQDGNEKQATDESQPADANSGEVERQDDEHPSPDESLNPAINVTNRDVNLDVNLKSPVTFSIFSANVKDVAALLGELCHRALDMIEKAVTGAFKPNQMKRMANAVACVAKKRDETEIEIIEVQEQALLRWFAEATREQGNIDNVMLKMLPLLRPGASPEKVAPDWINNLIGHARQFSDEHVQETWARILAGEMNQPGSFSRLTVNIVANMDQKEAQLFTDLCCLNWTIGPDRAQTIIWDEPADLKNRWGKSRRDNFELLECLQLIEYHPAGNYRLFRLDPNTSVDYFGQSLTVR